MTMPDTGSPQSVAATNDMAARNSRRHTDQVILALVGDVAVLKDQMAENTNVTKEVRDILSTFRIVGVAAKWLGTVTAAVAAAYATIKGFRS